MSKSNIFSKIFLALLRVLFSVKEDVSPLGNPKRILVIRQHNQFGDLLASVSLFRAIKETFPECELSVVVSPDNYYAVTKNKFIDRTFLFDKKKVFSFKYLKELFSFLQNKYDAVVVPATVSISATSCILSRLSDAQKRIGPESLEGKPNKLSFLFHHRVKLNWKQYPDAHVSEFSLDIVRPLGISTNDYTSEISFDSGDENYVSDFIKSNFNNSDNILIGLHTGAGKPPNRWSLDNYVEVINFLRTEYKADIFLTGSSSDQNEIAYIQEQLDRKAVLFFNQSIPHLAAMIARSDLFITNDTGVMHVAGATKTPQISIFGPTNPFNWAPLGENKKFIRKSEFISDIDADSVKNLCKEMLGKTLQETNGK